MKKHGNTLYVTTQGAYLARERTNVVAGLLLPGGARGVRPATT